MLQGKINTVSNSLSALRVVLLLPIVWALSQNTAAANGWALFLMALAVLTDFFDGFLARRLRQISDLGKVLDPVSDKICIIVVCWILSSGLRAHPLPLWFLLVIVGRDLAIVAGSYLIYRRGGFVVSSNLWGKTTTTIIALLLIVYVLDLSPTPVVPAWSSFRLGQFLIWMSLSFMLVSTLSYGRRLYQFFYQQRKALYQARFFAANNRQTQTQQNGGPP